MPILLKNKTILITGATGILGRNFSRAVFEAGGNVVVSDLSLSDCQKLKSKISKNSSRILPCKLDITDKDSIESCLNLVKKKFKRIDGLVNNAVLRAPSEGFFERAPESFKKTNEVNIEGAFLITQQVAKIMKSQKSGSIVNIASIYGIVGNDQSLYEKETNYDYYCFQKGGIVNFTRLLACRLGKYNIRANSLSPGGILWDKPNGGAVVSKKFRERYAKRTPLGRMAEPHEMNGALVFLLSDSAGYVTGHNLVVDGGWTAW